jgi:hypothetical protein
MDIAKETMLTANMRLVAKNARPMVALDAFSQRAAIQRKTA